MWKASLAIVLFGSLYRFDAYLVAYRPSEGFSYFPAVPELLITFGIFALEVAIYLWAVKTFPILQASPSAPVQCFARRAPLIPRGSRETPS